MKAVRWFLVMVFLALNPLFVTGCGFRPSQTAIVPTTATTTVASTSTIQPPTGTPKPTRTVLPPTPTEILPTATTTQHPPNWLVESRLLPDWSEESGYITWPNAKSIGVTGYGTDDKRLLYDLQTASLLSKESLPSSDDCQAEVYSRKFTYYVWRTDPTTDAEGYQTFHTLQLFRTQDKKLISQVENVAVLPCHWSIRWSNSEAILSFVSEKPSCNDSHFCFDIYAWRTDGSQPHVVGQGTYPDEPGTWSPDASRLAVEIYNWNATIPEDEYTYLIMYPDGRPHKETKGQLGNRSMHGVSWLTNTIIYEINSYGASCIYTEYFVADTGEKLTDLSWGGCFDSYYWRSQSPELSANQRWFILDQTKQDYVDPDQPYVFAYSLYDFHAGQSFPLSQSKEILIDFVGWNDSAFYFIRRPIDDRIVESSEAPFGLIELDPATRQMRLVNPGIRFAWLIPDADQLFAISRSEEQYTAAIYTLNGESVVQPVVINMPESTQMASIPELISKWNLPDEDPIQWAWSPNGKVVAVLDGDGSLWLISREGDAKKIAEHLLEPLYSLNDPTSSKRSNTSILLWSLQSEYLVVRSGAQAWVIDAK